MAPVQRSRISDAPDSAAKPRSTTRILKIVSSAAQTSSRRSRDVPSKCLSYLCLTYLCLSYLFLSYVFLAYVFLSYAQRYAQRDCVSAGDNGCGQAASARIDLNLAVSLAVAGLPGCRLNHRQVAGIVAGIKVYSASEDSLANL